MMDKRRKRLVSLCEIGTRRMQYEIAILYDARIAIENKREELSLRQEAIKVLAMYRCTDFMLGKTIASYASNQQMQIKALLFEILHLENEIAECREKAGAAFAKCNSIRSIIKRLDAQCPR